ncbi:PspC domain-containing protein [Thermococcus sp.]|uniref:PspC domain-containing protein n=1 Tax=Thermococcus sp. TaxID=35749 RepID=UPI0026067A42|nr:PspC domain-containing protein [Thermococcus sp.]
MAKRLVRSKKNRILLGVLGGLGEHLDLDPTLVRLLFIILLALNPVTMTLLYFIAAMIIPAEEGEIGEETLTEKAENVLRETGDRLGEIFSGSENNKAVALVLLLVGAVLLVGPFAPFLMPAVDFRTLTAVAFLVAGTVLLVKGE